HSSVVTANVLAGLLLVQLDEVLHHTLVKVLTTQMSVTIGGHHLEDAIVNGEQGDIKGATTEIKDQNVLLALLLVEAVGNGGGSGLVDDAHHIETGNGTGVLSRLTLGVVEVGGHSDHGVGDLLAEVSLSGLFHL